MNWVKRLKQGRDVLILAMIGFMVVLSLHQQGHAMLAPVEMAEAGPALSGRQADMAVIQSALEQRMVQQRLYDIGLTEPEVQQKLASLTDAEIHELAAQMESIAPAGDAGGFIIGLLVITLLVVLIIFLAKRI